MPILTLKNDQLTVTISTLGAEIQSITDANGIERLWEGDSAVWGGRAPVLFPFAGGLKDDYCLYEGKRYEMPKHGFARLKEFVVEESSATQATLLLDEKMPVYPFDYAFRVRFTLEGSALKVDYITENTGDGELYFGVGAHEAYACPEGIEAYRLVFDEIETLRTSALIGSQIAYDAVTVLENSRELPLKQEYFAIDALVFLGVQSRGVILKSDLHPRTVRVDFPGHDYLLVWTKPNAKYICIEPWTNPPEFVDSDHQLTHKPGMTRLLAHESKTFTHTISFE